MSVEILIWITTASIAVLLVTIWAIYKIVSYLRPVLVDPSREVQVESGNSSTSNFSGVPTATSTASSSLIVNSVPQQETIGYRLGAKRSKLSKGSGLVKSTLSSQASKSLQKVTSGIKSDGSRKSFGFEPIVKKYKGNNFLAILDQINALDEEEEAQRLRRRDRRIRTASSIGIDADSTDETASQTFIGREPDGELLPDPGKIQLGLINAQDCSLSDNSSEAELNGPGFATIENNTNSSNADSFTRNSKK